MSFRTAGRAHGADGLRSRLIVKTTRLALTVGLAAGLAVVTSAGGVATAGASVVAAADQGPGGGGNQGGGNQGGGGSGGGGLGGFRHLVIVTGTVGSVGTTSFTLTRGFGPSCRSPSRARLRLSRAPLQAGRSTFRSTHISRARYDLAQPDRRPRRRQGNGDG